MKKYLMTGMAALAICAAFTSCSKDTDVYNSGVIENNNKQSIVNSYNEAFVKTFGQPAANHNWGFVNYAKSSTRDANTEHNQWAAVDNIYKLLVPSALTPGQIQRVKAYFQNNRYLTYEDPHMTDFFVQQVYEGSTAPGALSTEVYTSANGASVKAGDHMDKLTVGVNETHVNDFNSADCGESDVLNNGTKQNNYVTNGTTHKDKITLMLGESTEYVGFWCSEGSVQHNDCCALAGADVIDAWAASDEAKALGIDLGEAVVDGWDRSFVGLDYEQISPEDLFRQKNIWPDGDRSEVKVWDFCSDTNNTNKVMLNGQLVDANTVPNDQLFFPNGEPVKWVADETNMYLGQNLGTNQNTFNKQENGVKYYDLDAVYACINQGAYPKVNNMEFIKGLGGRDYVFSDWIVTLTPAKKFQIEDPEYSLRVICEDLNAQAGEGDPEDSDWDFNDLVFDVKFLGSNQVQIQVVAVGGTLPIRINGEDALEAHGLYDQGTNIMINTGAGAKYPSQAYESNGIPEKAIFTRTIAGVDDSYGKNIKVEVKKGNDWIELTAEADQPAAKIGVEPTFDYCTERVDISGRYTNFISWIRTKNPVRWWNE